MHHSLIDIRENYIKTLNFKQTLFLSPHKLWLYTADSNNYAAVMKKQLDMDTYPKTPGFRLFDTTRRFR